MGGGAGRGLCKSVFGCMQHGRSRLQGLCCCEVVRLPPLVSEPVFSVAWSLCRLECCGMTFNVPDNFCSLILPHF